MVKYIMKPPGSTMTGTKLTQFDTAFSYKGYALVNERIQDDEGFYKNCWQWGLLSGEFVVRLEILDGLSSNAYSDLSEAMDVFKAKVNSK